MFSLLVAQCLDEYIRVVGRDDVDAFHGTEATQLLFAINSPDVDFQSELLCFERPFGMLVEGGGAVVDACQPHLFDLQGRDM